MGKLEDKRESLVPWPQDKDGKIGSNLENMNIPPRRTLNGRFSVSKKEIGLSCKASQLG